MTYIPEDQTSDCSAQVVYTGKTSQTSETFSAMDWLAKMVSHIPNKGEQTVRYYGYYSNKARGVRNKIVAESNVDANNIEIIKIHVPRKRFNKSWARLIQKVYNVDPLICPLCKGKMRIIAFIEEEALIKTILKHMKLWDIPESAAKKKSKLTNHSQPVIKDSFENSSKNLFSFCDEAKQLLLLFQKNMPKRGMFF